MRQLNEINAQAGSSGDGSIARCCRTFPTGALPNDAAKQRRNKILRRLQLLRGGICAIESV